MQIKNYLITISFLVFLLSCSTRKATINTYTDPTYTPGKIKTIAIFPARNAHISAGDAQQIIRKITQSLHKKNPHINIISSSESSRRLNEADMVDDWNYFLDTYISGGIPDSHVLRQIGDALRTDIILHGEIIDIFQQDGQFGGNKGTTRVTVHFSMLNTHEGKMIWEATSDGIRTTTTTIEKAPPLIEAINLAVDKILLNLPPI